MFELCVLIWLKIITPEEFTTTKSFSWLLSPFDWLLRKSMVHFYKVVVDHGLVQLLNHRREEAGKVLQE